MIMEEIILETPLPLKEKKNSANYSLSCNTISTFIMQSY